MDPSKGYSIDSFARAFRRARANQHLHPKPPEPEMEHLDQLRHQAARLLVDFLDYAPPTGDPAIATPTALTAVDAIASYAIAALVADPEGAIAKPAADVRADVVRDTAKLPPAPDPGTMRDPIRDG